MCFSNSLLLTSYSFYWLLIRVILKCFVVLCSIHRFDDISSIWQYEYRYCWPCIDIVARVQQCTALNLNTGTPFRLFNKHQCLIWPQRNTTSLPDIKRRNHRNGVSHLRNTEILAKCDTYTQPCVRALSPQWINALVFWKRRLACSLAISTSIYSQKSAEVNCLLCQ